MHMVIDKDFITLLTAGAMFVSSTFLSKKDKINRRDSIVERTIKIKKEMEETVLKILQLIQEVKITESHEENHEEIKAQIKEFWHQLDEIGSLHSVQV